MKPSIAITLIIVAAVFCFVSGYSIGTHSDQATSFRMASQSNSSSIPSARAAEKTVSPSGGYGAPSSGGYGAPSSEETGDSSEASPGYGAPSPGYGQ